MAVLLVSCLGFINLAIANPIAPAQSTPTPNIGDYLLYPYIFIFFGFFFAIFSFPFTIRSALKLREEESVSKWNLLLNILVIPILAVPTFFALEYFVWIKVTWLIVFIFIYFIAMLISIYNLSMKVYRKSKVINETA